MEAVDSRRAVCNCPSINKMHSIWSVWIANKIARVAKYLILLKLVLPSKAIIILLHQIKLLHLSVTKRFVRAPNNNQKTEGFVLLIVDQTNKHGYYHKNHSTNMSSMIE